MSGSGSGGTLPGGTPGSGAGGLGTCCASPNFFKTRVLSLRAARGSVIAFGMMIAATAPQGCRSPSHFGSKNHPSCEKRSFVSVANVGTTHFGCDFFRSQAFHMVSSREAGL
jgi:hypothetical protein